MALMQLHLLCRNTVSLLHATHRSCCLVEGQKNRRISVDIRATVVLTPVVATTYGGKLLLGVKGGVGVHAANMAPTTVFPAIFWALDAEAA